MALIDFEIVNAHFASSVSHFAYPCMTKTEEAKAIRDHEKLIRYAAQPFARAGVPIEDLLQEGRLALMLAARNWDPSRGVLLWTYARRFVMGAMFGAVSRALVTPLAEGDAPDEEAPGPSPDDAALVSELLASLTPEERQIVVCYFVGDSTLEELAAVTGRSFRGVKYVCDRALEKMRARADNAVDLAATAEVPVFAPAKVA